MLFTGREVRMGKNCARGLTSIRSRDALRPIARERTDLMDLYKGYYLHLVLSHVVVVVHCL